MIKTLTSAAAITLTALLSAAPAGAAEAPAPAATAAPALKVADIKADSLCARLPAGSRTAVLVKVEKLLASDFYKQLCTSFPEFPMALAVLEAQYQVPVKNIRQLIYFNGDNNRNGAVLFELKKLPEMEFAKRVAKLQSTRETVKPVDGIAIPGIQSLECRTAKIGSHTAYLISGQSAEGAERRTIGVTYLAPDVAVAAEEDALTAYLNAAPLGAPERSTLFVSDPNPENVAEVGFVAPPRNERKKPKNGAFGSVRNLESLQASCRLGGENVITIDGLGVMRDEKSAANAMMGINGLIFMGMGIFFAENQQLGDELLNNLSLAPEGRNISGNFYLNSNQLKNLLEYSKKRIPQLVMPPDEPVGAVEIPADPPPAKTPARPGVTAKP
ncbi:MAG: hypothetical protein AB7F32_01450 [Victivallaceae bacterium]